MIGNDFSLKPSGTSFKQKPAADLSGLVRPMGIADSSTMAAANNAFAGNIQKSTGRELYRGNGAYADKAGFSRNKTQSMMAANQEAAGMAAGAGESAAIQAEDQMFNRSLDSQYQQMVRNRLLDNQSDALQRQGLHWQKMFNRRSNQQQMMMRQAQNRQQVMQSLSQSLMQEG
jgi:hypothetical protein